MRIADHEPYDEPARLTLSWEAGWRIRFQHPPAVVVGLPSQLNRFNLIKRSEISEGTAPISKLS